MKPYYEAAGITIYHGDCREVLQTIPRVWASHPGIPRHDVLLTDPPYGIEYESGSDRTEGFSRSIVGDKDTSLRDSVIGWWGDGPALVFGSWKAQRPTGTRMILVWDQGGALGMGALDLPWKPSWQEVYVLGRGFTGRRDGAVLRCPPVQSMASNGRVHPHEKPLQLLTKLLAKCPPGAVLDPFMGSGTTLVAAKDLGRRAIGIEIEERYCEIAARRLSQEVLPLGGAA